jgi:hypothetical protein
MEEWKEKALRYEKLSEHNKRIGGRDQELCRKHGCWEQ